MTVCLNEQRRFTDGWPNVFGSRLQTFFIFLFFLLTTRLHSSCFAFWESTFNVGLIDYCNWTVVFASTLRQLLFDPLPTLVLIFANIVNHSTKLNIVPVVVGPIQHIRTGTIHLSDRWQARTTNEDRNIHVSMWMIFLHFFSLSLSLFFS